MEFSNAQIQPNALLKTKNLLSSWQRYCNLHLISKIMADMKQFNYPIEEVDGIRSYWDVTSYIENNHTDCTLEEKIKAIYSFSCVQSAILIRGKKYVGSSNVVAALIQSDLPVSNQLYDYLIECGYRQAHGESIMIE